MSRTARAIAASAALMFSLHMVSLHGQQKSGKPAPAPHAAKTTTARPQAPKSTTMKPATGTHATTKQQAPKAATSKAKAPKGTGAKPAQKSAEVTTQKTRPAAKPAATKTEKKNAASVKKASTKKADTTKAKKDASTKKADSTKKTDPATTATTTTTTPPLDNLSPVQQKLAKNTSLQNKLLSRLPAGTNLLEAADGFRNLGQFVAAVNVSKNLDIPFDRLKANMVTKKMSLGQSIQDLRPASSAAVEAQHAEYDAGTLIAQTEQETSLSVSAGVTTKTTTQTSTTATAKPRKSSRKTLTGGV